MKYITNTNTIQLPEPDLSELGTLADSLKGRKSGRNFDENKDFSLQEISNLIWAGYGENRSNGKKTFPLLWKVGLYLTHKNGIFKHNITDNTLGLVNESDVRDKLTEQDFVGIAPITFIFTMNTDEMTQSWIGSAGTMDFFIGNQTGAISQNLYLIAASMNISTVAISWFNRDYTNKVINAKGNEKAYLLQSVGK